MLPVVNFGRGNRKQRRGKTKRTSLFEMYSIVENTASIVYESEFSGRYLRVSGLVFWVSGGV